jgi:glycosyltransferase involved in cell wall biosynthesis
MRLSIIIPVRNEAAHLDGLLQFATAGVQPEREILVVDGRSEDGTREIIAAWQRRDPRVRLIDNPRRLVTAALNLGLQAATGEVIMRLDAHAQYAPDYLEQCLGVLEETGAGNVGGAARPVSDGSFLGDLIRAVHVSPFGIGAAPFRREDAEGWVDTVWPGCWRREALEAAGRSCREDLPRSEDIELNARLRAAGWRIYLSPKIVAFYQPRRSLGALLRQNFDNGAGVIHTLQAGRGGVRLRHLAPLAAGLAGIALGLGGLWWTPAWWILLALLAVHLAGGLAFAARAVGWRRPGLILALPPVFFLLHAAYGLGSLIGAVTRPRLAHAGTLS